ncbi:MAG: ComF family protein [Clostridium argentinense]|nr:ComF family protein [Clostridium argentinense]
MGRRIFKILKYLLHCISLVIYPTKEQCIICKSYTKDKIICNNCENKIKFINKSFYIIKGNRRYKCYIVSKYDDVVKKLVLSLKYSNNYLAAELLGNYIGDLVEKEKLKVDIITFVPISKKVRKKRGYNQAKLLAEAVSSKINKPCLDLLEKFKETKDQIGLDKEERWSNVCNCFKFNEKLCIEGKNILLIDDVITTGATAINCVNLLKKSGAGKVYILTASKSVV